MNQNEILLRLKDELNQFPLFLKDILKRPLSYIHHEKHFDWIKVLTYIFLVEGLTGVLYSIGLLNFGSLVGAAVFQPLQTITILAFMSFILWLLFDRLGLSRLNFLMIFKLLSFAEAIVSLFAVLPLIILFYVKSFYGFHFLAMAIIIAKAYLVYLGFDKQFQLSKKRSLVIVLVFASIYLIQAFSDFYRSYDAHNQVQQLERINEEQTEDAIKEIEKDLGIKMEE